MIWHLLMLTSLFKTCFIKQTNKKANKTRVEVETQQYCKKDTKVSQRTKYIYVMLNCWLTKLTMKILPSRK